MRDRSSFRNARPYIIVATEANPAEPLPAVPEPLVEPAQLAATTLPLEAAAAPFKPAVPLTPQRAACLSYVLVICFEI